MCGRYTLTKPGDALAELDLDDEGLDAELLAPRFNVAPTQRLPVVRSDGAVATRPGPLSAAPMRWGFGAHARRGSGKLLINARSESVTEKPSFREAFAERRCLVPADGFFEWRRNGRDRLAYHFHRPDRGVFFFAGLWQAERGHDEPGYVVLTTRANDAVAHVHDRMPVILDADRGRTWLAEAPEAELLELLAPLPAVGIESTAVGPGVNKVTLDDPSLVEPVRHVENLTLF
ncbi:MAG: SOS response-associated peptidase [Acidobacteriota bacterium]